MSDWTRPHRGPLPGEAWAKRKALLAKRTLEFIGGFPNGCTKDDFYAAGLKPAGIDRLLKLRQIIGVQIREPDRGPRAYHWLWKINRKPDRRQGDSEMTGAQLIAQERQRQIEEEGFCKDHDCDHEPEHLALAGRAYAYLASFGNIDPATTEITAKDCDWPWHETWFKPKGQLSNMVRAGALIAAAIDRLQAKMPEGLFPR